VQTGQHGAGDVADQAGCPGDDITRASDQVRGGLDGDLVTGPVGVDARHGGNGVGDGDGNAWYRASSARISC
jgi:hypothetical protein